jgi:hypothetical protein
MEEKAGCMDCFRTLIFNRLIERIVTDTASNNKSSLS